MVRSTGERNAQEGRRAVVTEAPAASAGHSRPRPRAGTPPPGAPPQPPLPPPPSRRGPGRWRRSRLRRRPAPSSPPGRAAGPAPRAPPLTAPTLFETKHRPTRTRLCLGLTFGRHDGSELEQRSRARPSRRRHLAPAVVSGWFGWFGALCGHQWPLEWSKAVGIQPG